MGIKTEKGKAIGTSLQRNPEWQHLNQRILPTAFAVIVAEFFFSPQCALLTLLWSGIGYGYFWSFTRRRYEKMADLSLTIDRILHGEESIRLSQYKEGEFAILENELEKMTIRLREQNESLKGEKIYLAEMLADISHQIRTPLTALNLLVTRMGREAIRKERQEEGRLLLLQEMKRLLERVEWLVTTLLKLSRLDAGCVSFQKERFSVRELLMNAAEPFFVPMELRGQELEVQAAETIFSEGDAVWLTEAVGNLIKNSMEHTHQGGRITLLAEENPIYVQIKVLDNGEGIAEEALPHLFERFYKGENASSGSFGIGLSFAEKIVTKQGGVIHAENIPDGGACFTVRFYKTAV